MKTQGKEELIGKRKYLFGAREIEDTTIRPVVNAWWAPRDKENEKNPFITCTFLQHPCMVLKAQKRSAPETFSQAIRFRPLLQTPPNSPNPAATSVRKDMQTLHL